MSAYAYAKGECELCVAYVNGDTEWCGNCHAEYRNTETKQKWKQ
jgi:RNA polymerase subunit RPABC4/transcription elongation factor Spt4